MENSEMRIKAQFRLAVASSTHIGWFHLTITNLRTRISLFEQFLGSNQRRGEFFEEEFFEAHFIIPLSA